MTRQQHSARTWTAIVGASLALHAVLLTRTCGERPPPGDTVLLADRELGGEVVEIELEFDLDREVAPPSAPRAGPELTPPTSVTKKTPQRPLTSASPSGAEQIAQPEPVDSAVRGHGPSGADAPMDAAPTEQRSGFVLLPSQSFGAGLGTDGLEELEAGTRGTTVRNTPEETPDARAVAEYTEEKLKRKLDAELAGEVGAARVQNGLAPRYFNRVQGALRETLASSPVELRRKPADESIRDGVKDAAETWLLPAQQYGATGSPVTSPEDTRALEQSGLGRTMNQGWRPLGSDEHQAREMNGTMQALATTEILKRSAQRERLRTIVALQQDWSGALAEVRIVKKSNDDTFDEWVLAMTRRVFREHGERDHDEVDLPYQPEGWSSEWQFTYEPPHVRVKLLRVMPGPLPPVR